MLNYFFRLTLHLLLLNVFLNDYFPFGSKVLPLGQSSDSFQPLVLLVGFSVFVDIDLALLVIQHRLNLFADPNFLPCLRRDSILFDNDRAGGRKSLLIFRRVITKRFFLLGVDDIFFYSFSLLNMQGKFDTSFAPQGHINEWRLL